MFVGSLDLENLEPLDDVTRYIKVSFLGSETSIYEVKSGKKEVQLDFTARYMPARVGLFDVKAELIHDFGTGPRNAASYNPWGNLLTLSGFGNLRGNVEASSSFPFTNLESLPGKSLHSP